MKTPMQELIEELKELRDDYRTIVTIDAGLPIYTAIMLAESMLKKEKEVIENAWNSAYYGDNSCGGEDYYNETFNSKEK